MPISAHQSPTQARRESFAERFGGFAGVLPPHVSTPGTPVATHPDQQRRRTPAHRLVRQPTRHHVPGRALRAAPPTPIIRFHHLAHQHRLIGCHFLADSSQAELIEPAKRGQVRRSEGSVEHVEVFPVGSVRTSITGRPRRLSRDRRAHPAYTLNCDEPHFLALSDFGDDLLRGMSACHDS